MPDRPLRMHAVPINALGVVSADNDGLRMAIPSCLILLATCVLAKGHTEDGVNAF